ncbi:MAG: dTMP kinase [Phycisphaerales bacterium]|nr:dTMP kinase [Phycisphaerales bacterium]
MSTQSFIEAVPTMTTPPQELPDSLKTALRGKFLVFDGPDGSGKSTQLVMFLKAVRDAGIEVTEVREPGGTEVGEKIRDALLDHLDRETMSLRCEMLLYMASRAQLCEQLIAPSLKKGHLVVADRFVSSTYAYQGTAGGIPIAEIDAAAKIAMQGTEPDATLIFDVDQDTAASRLNPLLDRMEAKGAAFHAKVRQGYQDLIKSDPTSTRYLRVDAKGTPDQVFGNILDVLTDRFVENR